MLLQRLLPQLGYNVFREEVVLLLQPEVDGRDSQSKKKATQRQF